MALHSKKVLYKTTPPKMNSFFCLLETFPGMFHVYCQIFCKSLLQIMSLFSNDWEFVDGTNSILFLSDSDEEISRMKQDIKL